MRPLPRLMTMALRFRGDLAVAALSIALLSATQLYLTWLLKRWVEGPLVTRNAAELRALLTEGAATAAIGMVSLFLSRYFLAAANQKMMQRLREEAMASVFAARVPAVRTHATGDLLSRVFHDVSHLSTFLSTVLRRLIGESIVLAGAVVLMFVLEWRLALATFTLVPLTAFVLLRMGRRIRAWSAISQQATGTLTAAASERLHGLTTVKVYQAERAELQRFHAMADALRRKTMRGELWAATLIAAVFLLTGAGVIAILAFGTIHVNAGVTQATFVAFCLYAAQTVEPLRRLSEVHALLMSGSAAAERVFEVIDLGPREEQGRLPAPEGTIRFDDVWFGYDGTDVLRGLSLSIEAGEMIGIAGASGCGKSTLASLLVRFDEPRRGTITIDGVPLHEIRLSDLRRDVCLVEQQPFLFSGSLADNIRYGGGDDIEEAVRMIGLDLRATVDEAGRDLSGGEKQRIAIARAIVRDPRVVIFDEATSAVDSESETEMFEAMRPWLERRTVIVVAHRLATLRRLPRVVLLSGGRIVADGDPETLLSTCGALRELFADQLPWSSPGRFSSASSRG